MKFLCNYTTNTGMYCKKSVKIQNTTCYLHKSDFLNLLNCQIYFYRKHMIKCNMLELEPELNLRIFKYWLNKNSKTCKYFMNDISDSFILEQIRFQVQV